MARVRSLAAFARLLPPPSVRSAALDTIRAGGHPPPADIAAALTERIAPPGRFEGVRLSMAEDDERRASGLPLPEWIDQHISDERRQAARERAWQRRLAEQVELAAYVAKYYVRAVGRPQGRKATTYYTAAERRILSDYAKRVKRVAPGKRGVLQESVALDHGIGKRTLQALIRDFDFD